MRIVLPPYTSTSTARPSKVASPTSSVESTGSPRRTSAELAGVKRTRRFQEADAIWRDVKERRKRADRAGERTEVGKL